MSYAHRLKQTKKGVRIALPEEEYKHQLRSTAQKQPFSSCLEPSSDVSQPVPSQDHILVSTRRRKCREAEGATSQLRGAYERNRTEKKQDDNTYLPPGPSCLQTWKPSPKDRTHPAEPAGCSPPTTQPPHGPPHPSAPSLTCLYSLAQRLPKVWQGDASREAWSGTCASQHSVRVCSLWDGGCQLKGLRLPLQGLLTNVNSWYHKLPPAQ